MYAVSPTKVGVSLSIQLWRERAACRGLDQRENIRIFFPSGHGVRKDRWDAAWSFCRRCEVHRECLAMIMEVDAIDDKIGMFGGLTPNERLQLRRGRIYFDKDFDDGFRYRTNLKL
jgi:hypothetical protein